MPGSDGADGRAPSAGTALVPAADRRRSGAARQGAGRRSDGPRARDLSIATACRPIWNRPTRATSRSTSATDSNALGRIQVGGSPVMTPMLRKPRPEADGGADAEGPLPVRRGPLRSRRARSPTRRSATAPCAAAPPARPWSAGSRCRRGSLPRRRRQPASYRSSTHAVADLLRHLRHAAHLRLDALSRRDRRHDVLARRPRAAPPLDHTTRLSG